MSHAICSSNRRLVPFNDNLHKSLLSGGARNAARRRQRCAHSAAADRAIQPGWSGWGALRLRVTRSRPVPPSPAHTVMTTVCTVRGRSIAATHRPPRRLSRCPRSQTCESETHLDAQDAAASWDERRHCHLVNICGID